MEVSQIASLDTHAVIGGATAQAFRMSESAEFFTVLSDTLYRDKKRAVVREIVCNAWDAHIMVGKQDVPVDVKISDTEMSIRDVGPGIADDRIVDIYCVYGASTKVKDESQTGGFGLGSKAPFAYADHFTVTSCYQGIKTVYAISRGGLETDGKPDIRAMVRVPTTDTGITVTVPVRGRDDAHELRDHLRHIVRFGSIKATLDNQQLETLDYTEARERGWCLYRNPIYDGNEAKIYLLYGTVLYPVTTTDKEISALANKLSDVIARGAVILFAPPNSIGVTPSREALSYTDLTRTTVMQLLNRMLNDIRSAEKQAYAEFAKRNVAKRYGIQTHGCQMPNDDRRFSSVMTSDPVVAAMVHVHAQHYGHRYYADLHPIKARLEKAVLAAATAKWPADRRIFRRYRSHKGAYRYRYGGHAARLAIRLAGKVGLLRQLRVFVPDVLSHQGSLSFMRTRFPDSFIPANELVVGETVQQVSAYMKDRKKSDSPTLCLVVPKKTSAAVHAEIDRLAKHYGLEIDRIKNFAPPPRKKVVKLTPKAPTFFGLAEVRGDILPNEPVLESADTYLVARRSCGRIYGVNGALSLRPTLTSLFPKIALAFTNAEVARLGDIGAKPLIPALTEMIEAAVKDRSFLYAYMAESRSFLKGRAYMTGSLESLMTGDIRLTKLLFPARVTVNDETLCLAKMVARGVSDIQEDTAKADRERLRAATEAIRKEAHVQFGDLVVDGDTFLDRHPYMEIVCALDDYRIRQIDKTKSKDAILDIVKFLKRRHHQSAVTDQEVEKAA